MKVLIPSPRANDATIEQDVLDYLFNYFCKINSLV